MLLIPLHEVDRVLTSESLDAPESSEVAASEPARARASARLLSPAPGAEPDEVEAVPYERRLELREGDGGYEDAELTPAACDDDDDERSWSCVKYEAASCIDRACPTVSRKCTEAGVRAEGRLPCWWPRC